MKKMAGRAKTYKVDRSIMKLSACDRCKLKDIDDMLVVGGALLHSEGRFLRRMLHEALGDRDHVDPKLKRLLR